MKWSNNGFSGQAISFGADVPQQNCFVKKKFLIVGEPEPRKTEVGDRSWPPGSVPLGSEHDFLATLL